jgi:hypothetical protein
MIRKIVGGAENGRSAVAEETVEMPTGVNNSRHNDLEHGRSTSLGLQHHGQCAILVHGLGGPFMSI